MYAWWCLIGVLFGVAGTLIVLRLRGHSVRCRDTGCPYYGDGRW